MKSSKGAMEMSVGTIVTIVLLMSVLVLGIFLVQKVFKTGTSAVDSIGNEVESEIQKLFEEEGAKLAIYPTSREIVLKKGDDPKGFAFSVKNKDVEEADFTYSVMSNDVSKCGSLTNEEADSWLLGGEGSFSLGSGNSLGLPKIVRFIIPETAPACSLTYDIAIEKDSSIYESGDILVTIK